MARQDDLRDFVRTALAAGQAHGTVTAALTAAGWSAAEAEAALAAWDLRPDLPPVPRRPRPALTAAVALVEALHLVALVMVTWHLAQVAFTLTDLWLPALPWSDVVFGPDWRLGALRWSIAALIVFLPLYLWAQRRAARPPRTTLSVWIGHLAVFLAIISLLGDALAVVYAALDGDLTLSVLVKAAAVALIAGAVLAIYREGKA